MPWTMSDAPRHTHKATSTAKRKQWSATANAVLAKSGDEAKAIRIANAAVKKTTKKKTNAAASRRK